MTLQRYLAVVGLLVAVWLLVGAVVVAFYLRYCRAVAAAGSSETQLYMAAMARNPGAAILFMCVAAILWPEPFWEMARGADR